MAEDTIPEEDEDEADEDGVDEDAAEMPGKAAAPHSQQASQPAGTTAVQKERHRNDYFDANDK